jgi:ribosomal-protein-alanine N-acetyltransferase
MSFSVRPINETDVWAILAWRYPPPYNFYNLHPANFSLYLKAFLNPKFAYHAVTAGNNELAGYCCFGSDAQVQGGDYTQLAALDIGLGLKPGLTGQGLGAEFLSTILAFATVHFTPTHFRATIAAFNRRSLRVFQEAKFQPHYKFIRPTDPPVGFIQVWRPANL